MNVADTKKSTKPKVIDGLQIISRDRMAASGMKSTACELYDKYILFNGTLLYMISPDENRLFSYKQTL